MEFKERVLKENGHTILTDWNGHKYNWEIGEESTADGYELFYVKENGEELNIENNLFQYKDGATDKIGELLENETGLTFMFWDSDLVDEIDWEDICDNLNLIFEYEEEEEVFELWKESELQSVRDTFEKDGVPDKPARNESFNNFTDGLCKEGKISEEMYNTICLPDHLETTNL